MRMLRMGCAVTGATIALFAALAPAASAATPLAGCGNGFTLLENPSYEAAIAAATHGNVNGDGFVCRNNVANPRGLHIVIDNNVPLR